VALEYDPKGKTGASIDAYERAFLRGPGAARPADQLWTLYYEDGNLEKASEYFRQALVLRSGKSLAHFNLGSVLDEKPDMLSGAPTLRQASG